MYGITDLSLNFLTGRPFLTGIFFILFILFAVYLYRRTNPPLPRLIRGILIALRIIALAALFLALFEPVLSFRREFERKPKLTLLVDRSKSMDIVENDKSRSQRVDSLLSSDRFENFADFFDVHKVSFAGDIFGNQPKDIEKTALGEVLDKLAGREMAQPSEAWLLLSDGISNGGISPVEVTPDINTPIYSIGFGFLSSEKDVAIGQVEHNNIVFAGKPTDVKVQISWQGMDNDNVAVKIQSGNKTLVSKNVTLPPGNLKDEIELKFSPEKPGQQAFTASVTGFADEISPDNNKRSFSMTVLKSRMKVLLVSDRLDQEYAFLNRFLLNSESVELTQVVYKKGGGYYRDAFPSEQAALNRYDLIILYNIDINSLKSKDALIESFLKDKGGGMFVLLGDNYLKSPFPRWLDKYLPFVETRKKSKVLNLKYNGRPAENNLFHPALRISDSRQGIREAWQNLPHFEALVPLDSMTPNSMVLATASLQGERTDYPILGYRRFGAGKVLATSAMPYWHWAFFGYGFGGDDHEYRQFLDGIVNWLSIKEESDPITISPDKTIYTRGEKVSFKASVFDLGFRPILGASGYIALIGENDNDTTISQFVESGDGLYRADYDILPPGRYKYIGKIEKEGKKLKETSGQIVIEAFSIEEFQRRPDFGILADVSRKTGGDFYALNNVDSLYNSVGKERVTESVQKEIILWNKFWLLALFILALSAEWLLRKQFQLI